MASPVSLADIEQFFADEDRWEEQYGKLLAFRAWETKVSTKAALTAVLAELDAAMQPDVDEVAAINALRERLRGMVNQ